MLDDESIGWLNQLCKCGHRRGAHRATPVAENIKSSMCLGVPSCECQEYRKGQDA